MSKYDDPVLYYQNQVDQWQQEFEQEANERNRAVCRQLRNEAASLNAEFQRVLYGFLEHGLGLTLKSGTGYCLVLADASEPGRFRYQTFNETGFTGHVTRDTPEQVLLEAFRDGFRHIDTTGALDRFSRTIEWEKGTLINDLVRRVNQGDLTHQQANTLYESGLMRISAKTQTSSALSAH